MDEGLVPEGLRDRAIVLALVPLVPGETLDLPSPVPRDAAALAAHLTRGADVDEIARALHVSRRTAFRRIEALREHLEARNIPELAAKLARLGF